MFAVGAHANRLVSAGQLEHAETAYRTTLDMLQAEPATEMSELNIAVSYHQLGMVAQLRGELDEAEQWYRKSLAIREQLNNQPGMASSYHQLGTAAQDRGELGSV